MLFGVFGAYVWTRPGPRVRGSNLRNLPVRLRVQRNRDGVLPRPRFALEHHRSLRDRKRKGSSR